MSDWKSVLKADPVDWLLEKDNPSVRYFALSRILDKPQNSSEVQEAKSFTPPSTAGRFGNSLFYLNLELTERMNASRKRASSF